ncbi:MAG: AAA family ATPase [Caulobacterales bacterium]
MKPQRLIAVLEKLLTQRWPAFVWGPPGVGKSAIVRHVAGRADLPVIDLRASLLDPTDLRGIPTIADGRAVWLPPSFLPRAEDKPGVLFLDEINAAPALVQASLYQLVLDRRVGEYVLPPGWWIVAAGNRQQDRAVTFRMSSALANRFVHVTLEPHVDDWRDWAIAAGLDPLVVSFIGFRPELLSQQPGQEAAFATPRSWEMLSDVLKSFGAVDACRDLVAGIVGEGPGREFLRFAGDATIMDMIGRIVSDPSGAELPDTLDRIYVLTSWLALNAGREDVVAAAAALLGRLPPEFAVVLARDMLRAHPKFARNPRYREFLKAHGHLISG